MPDDDGEPKRVKINDIGGKKNVYKDPALLRAKQEAAEKKKKPVKKSTPKKVEKIEKSDDTPAKRVYIPVPQRNSERPSLRESTKRITLAVVARKKANEEKAKLKPPKIAKIVKTYTQEELLEESKETMKLNRESLAELMKYEENMKRIELKKRAITGPRAHYRSKGGVNTVSFTDASADPLVTNASYEAQQSYPKKKFCVEHAVELAEKSDTPVGHNFSNYIKSLPEGYTGKICPISGKPAPYFDPLTQTPFADLRAFQILRAYYEVEKQKSEYAFFQALSSRAPPPSYNNAGGLANHNGSSTAVGVLSRSGVISSATSSSGTTGDAPGRATRSNPMPPETLIGMPPAAGIKHEAEWTPSAAKRAPTTTPKSTAAAGAHITSPSSSTSTPKPSTAKPSTASVATPTSPTAKPTAKPTTTSEATAKVSSAAPKPTSASPAVSTASTATAKATAKPSTTAKATVPVGATPTAQIIGKKATAATAPSAPSPAKPTVAKASTAATTPAKATTAAPAHAPTFPPATSSKMDVDSPK